MIVRLWVGVVQGVEKDEMERDWDGRTQRKGRESMGWREERKAVHKEFVGHQADFRSSRILSNDIFRRSRVEAVADVDLGI